MYKKILTSSFVRNVITVASGAAGAQALTMLFAPVITRMYGAEAFGMLGIFTSILAVLVPVAALAYPIAIVLPKSDDSAKGIVKLSILIATFISAVVFLVLAFFGNNLASWLNIESIAHYLILIPFALFFAAAEQIMQQWLIRKKQFKVMARVSVSQSLIINICKVGIGVFYPLGVVLVTVATLNNALYAFQLWLASRKWTSAIDRISFRNPSSANLRDLAYDYRDFPFYRAPQQFINALSQSLPVLMLASFFGPTSAGFYTLAKAVMAVPSMLIGKAVGDVFYPHITEAAHNKENLFRLISKATIVLASLGFFPFGLVIIFGPWIFDFIFGDEWVVAGEYARWLSIWLYFGFLNRPSVAAIATLSLQKFFLGFEVFSVILRTFALFVGFFLYESDLVAIILFSLTAAFLNIFLVLKTLFDTIKLRG